MDISGLWTLWDKREKGEQAVMIDRLLKPLNAAYNQYILRKYRIYHGQNLQIRGRIYAMGNIEIGNDVTMNSGFRYNPIGGAERTILMTHGDGLIRIGNHVGLSNCALVSRCRITVGDDVLIGGGCKIYDNDFHSLEYEKRMMKPDVTIGAKPVEIKKGAFIGAHSIILKGVTIGEKAVIGAGSVVTKDIPDNEIWAGNPARFIKVCTES